MPFDPTLPHPLPGYGVLLQLPLYLLDFVYHRRFAPPTNDASGAEDAAEVLQKLESEPEYRAGIKVFVRRLHQFQILLRYIRVMYELGMAQQMYRFDVFDVEAYDVFFTARGRNDDVSAPGSQ